MFFREKDIKEINPTKVQPSTDDQTQSAEWHRRSRHTQACYRRSSLEDFWSGPLPPVHLQRLMYL
jgi:hypothetical protein